MTGIHAVHFLKSRWTLKRTEKWLEKHNLIPIKDVDITDKFYRYRILPRSKKYNYITKKLSNGINLVIRIKSM